MPRRALLLILDSVGCGAAPDAGSYGDSGADTLGHIYERFQDFSLPTLEHMGLASIRGCHSPCAPTACWGRMRERSVGKDTTTGHWEIAGASLERPFATFEQFPPSLVSAIEQEAGVEFIGNFPCSGTVVIERLGGEHLRTGKPILYTSADSVMQIAAHVDLIPLPRLLSICEVARKHCDGPRIGRVIARPFSGAPGKFARTAGRHDYAMQPPPTVLNSLTAAGWRVHGIGKISDIFAGSGITASAPTNGNAEGMHAIASHWHGCSGLLFANLVDFDSLHEHRRDIPGYANALIQFDRWLAGFLPAVCPEDLLMITADHGNDPAHHGTDHTREEVPLLVKYRERCIPLGTRSTFSDVAATLAAFFEIPGWTSGTSFLPE